ncbi:MAG TPA: chromosomal replication initiator protein DnaA [Patescibacteria group bacterium]
MTDTGIWQAVLGELEVTTSKAHFQTWLKRTKLHSINESEAVISVPDVFVRSWVENHYKDQFLISFHKHGQTIESVRFLIDGSTAVPVVEMEITDHPKENQIKYEQTRTPTLDEAPSSINPSRIFETYVEGNNNRLAYAVCKAVAQSPGTLYNPLFIYGGVGMGKTHLMHAIANEVLKQDKSKKVLYVSSEKFASDYITGLASKSINKFKQTYRSLDLLLIDDIQFIANKEGTQEEFFNTFNTLHQSNRQIVIAADRVPKAISGLEERLTSRFGWGMVVDIQPPNFETRLAILKSKCTEKGVTLPEDALEYIATQIQSNIRELEGTLNRVVTYCMMTQVPFSLESVRMALSGLITPVDRKTLSVETVLSVIAEHFGSTVDNLLGKRRNKELVYPRHITMYILREQLDMSFPVIGRELGGKDHTTVMHGYNKICNDLENPRVQSDISRIKERLASI